MFTKNTYLTINVSSYQTQNLCRNLGRTSSLRIIKMELGFLMILHYLQNKSLTTLLLRLQTLYLILSSKIQQTVKVTDKIQ